MQAATMPIASLRMWTDAQASRSCLIRVFDGTTCIVDVHANGEHVFRPQKAA